MSQGLPAVTASFIPIFLNQLVLTVMMYKKRISIEIAWSNLRAYFSVNLGTSLAYTLVSGLEVLEPIC
jgi:hypothetical protein